jgi:hypothetical protein
VADVGQEHRLGAVGVLGAIARLRQLGLQRQALADVGQQQRHEARLAGLVAQQEEVAQQVPARLAMAVLDRQQAAPVALAPCLRHHLVEQLPPGLGAEVAPRMAHLALLPVGLGQPIQRRRVEVLDTAVQACQREGLRGTVGQPTKTLQRALAAPVLADVPAQAEHAKQALAGVVHRHADPHHLQFATLRVAGADLLHHGAGFAQRLRVRLEQGLRVAGRHHLGHRVADQGVAAPTEELSSGAVGDPKSAPGVAQPDRVGHVPEQCAEQGLTLDELLGVAAQVGGHALAFLPLALQLLVGLGQRRGGAGHLGAQVLAPAPQHLIAPGADGQQRAQQAGATQSDPEGGGLHQTGAWQRAASAEPRAELPLGVAQAQRQAHQIALGLRLQPVLQLARVQTLQAAPLHQHAARRALGRGQQQRELRTGTGGQRGAQQGLDADAGRHQAGGLAGLALRRLEHRRVEQQAPLVVAGVEQVVDDAGGHGAALGQRGLDGLATHRVADFVDAQPGFLASERTEPPDRPVQIGHRRTAQAAVGSERAQPLVDVSFKGLSLRARYARQVGEAAHPVVRTAQPGGGPLELGQLQADAVVLRGQNLQIGDRERHLVAQVLGEGTQLGACARLRAHALLVAEQRGCRQREPQAQAERQQGLVGHHVAAHLGVQGRQQQRGEHQHAGGVADPPDQPGGRQFLGRDAADRQQGGQTGAGGDQAAAQNRQHEVQGRARTGPPECRPPVAQQMAGQQPLRGAAQAHQGRHQIALHQAELLLDGGQQDRDQAARQQARQHAPAPGHQQGQRQTIGRPQHAGARVAHRQRGAQARRQPVGQRRRDVERQPLHGAARLPGQQMAQACGSRRRGRGRHGVHGVPPS